MVSHWVASQLQGIWFEPEHDLLLMWSVAFSPHIHVGSLQVLRIGYAELPLGLKVCVHGVLS